MCQEFVPPFAGEAQIVGSQGSADTLFGALCAVKGEVAPPCAVVVPQMMIRAARWKSQGELDE